METSRLKIQGRGTPRPNGNQPADKQHRHGHAFEKRRSPLQRGRRTPTPSIVRTRHPARLALQPPIRADKTARYSGTRQATDKKARTARAIVTRSNGESLTAGALREP